MIRTFAGWLVLFPFMCLIGYVVLNYVPTEAVEELPSYTQYELLDQNNEKITLAKFQGAPLFISFIFTRCPMPEMCPLTMRLTKRLQKKAKTVAPEMKFLVVTVDPEYDRPEILKNYATTHQLDPDVFTLVTGEQQTIDNLVSEIANIIAIPNADNSSISHNIKSALLSSNLEVVEEFKDNEWKPEQVLEKLRTLQVAE